MNIKIDNNYSLRSDLRNVILVENKIIQEGENKGNPTETTVGYYGTVEGALNGYLKVKTNLSDATSIKELLDEIKNVKNTIKEVLKGI